MSRPTLVALPTDADWTDDALDRLLTDIALGDVEDKARAVYTRCAPSHWHGRVVDLNDDGGDDLLARVDGGQ